MIAPRDISRPRPGYFTVKLAKGGVLVPARIWRLCHCTPVGGPNNRPHDWSPLCDRFPPLYAEIDGKPASVDRLWTSGREIDKAEYDYMVANTQWARQYTPGDPIANPRQPVDVTKLPPPQFD